VRTFANSPALAETHVSANVSMWTRSGLTPQEVEYVILAVGREMDSEYEWHDHVIAAHERAGLSKAEIRAIGARDTESMSPSKRALVEYAFELVREYGEVSDERHDQLATHYDDRTVVGVAMLASYYVFIQHAAAALGIPFEDEFVGWELERY
jgi:alkylhydroperoxidase family enzyme